MNKFLWSAGCAALLCCTGSFAAQPTDINYCARGKTALGTSYSTYTVRCSDGKKREITSWENRKKWCVGTSSQCTSDQLKAAQLACAK